MCWAINGKTFDKMYDAGKYVLELASRNVPVTVTTQKLNKQQSIEKNIFSGSKGNNVSERLAF